MNKERPIIFSSEPVKAILEGGKTMTRRLIKWPRIFWVTDTAPDTKPYWRFEEASGSGPFIPSDWIGYCPYGQPGDRLYIKETWGIYSCREDGDLVKYKVKSQDDIIPGHCLVFKASDSFKGLKGWRSPRFMPKWVSRTNLEIVAVRVERLQEISLGDISREGIRINPNGSWTENHYTQFECLWDSIYSKKPQYQWQANPWVWCITFKREDLT